MSGVLGVAIAVGFLALAMWIGWWTLIPMFALIVLIPILDSI